MLPFCPLPSTRAGTFSLAAIFLAALSRYFALPDNGGTSQPVNNGLTTGNGIKALIATVNGYLFARSYGDGVFRLK